MKKNAKQEIQGTMTKLLFPIILICFSLKAMACQCPERDKEINYFDYQFSDLIFLGKCEKIIKKGNDNYSVFTIEKVFKGSYTGTTITLLSSINNSADCKITYQPQQRWINIVNNTSKGYFGSWCEKSNISNNEIIKKLEKFTEISKIKNQVISLETKETLIKGKILNGREEGVWNYYYFNKKRQFYQILFHNGKMLQLYTFNKNGIRNSCTNYDSLKTISVTGGDGKDLKNGIRLKYLSDSIVLKQNFSNNKILWESKINLKTGESLSINKKTSEKSKSNYFIEKPTGNVDYIKESFYPKFFPPIRPHF